MMDDNEKRGMMGAGMEGKKKRKEAGARGKRGMVIGMVVLAILAAGGVGFGVYGMIKMNGGTAKENAVNTEGGEKVTTTKTIEKGDGTTEEVTVEVKTVDSSAQIKAALRGLIDRYTSDTMLEKDNIFEYGLDNDDYRFLAAVKNYNYDVAVNRWDTYNYDGLNKIYQSLFGEDMSIGKRNYTTGCSTYDYDNYTYASEYFVAVEHGCGGTLIPRAAYAVTDYREIENGFEVDTVYAQAPYDDTKMENGEIASYIELKNGERYYFYQGQETAEAAVEKNAAQLQGYRFTFEKVGNNYVLRGFAKK